MRNQRIHEVEKYISKNKTVSLDQLCEHFGISKTTLRRDLKILNDIGVITKVYGGVQSNPHSTLHSFEERYVKNADQKQSIAKAAAQFVENGDVIFIDSGTTTMYLLNYLKDKNFTVLTHNLFIINEAASMQNVQLFVLPGYLNRLTHSFLSTDIVAYLERYNINKVFMASTGVAIGIGATHGNFHEYEIKKCASGKNCDTILLVDSSKFGVASMMTYAPLSSFQYVVTEKKPPEEYINCFEENKIQLVISQ